MDKALLDSYAEVLLDACLGVRNGDRLRIVGEHSHREFMLIVAEGAYRRGARQVRLEYADARLRRVFADHAREEWIEDVSALVERSGSVFVEEGWSLLRLVGEDEPSALEGADSGRLQRASAATSRANKAFFEAQISNKVIWCVAPFPTTAWGKETFERNGRPLPEDPRNALMDVLGPILRLEGPKPGEAVLGHARSLAALGRRLDGLKLAELRFLGPGTDLKVGLSPRSTWIGGGSTTPGGRFFLPNHPTEEVFTSPDFRLTEGRVACTRPVEVLGATVAGAWFEFKDGQVVRSGAERNAEALERYLETDPGARRLGEVALVDSRGPIFRSGLVFRDGLIDENAACHIALGSAYTEAFQGSDAMGDTEKAEAGFNESLVHTDFMIGSPEVEVRGLTRDGKDLALITKGAFAV